LLEASFWETDGTAARRWKGRQPMAINFKIFQLKNRNSVHLTLDGDFDGTSAHELVNTLKSYGPDVEQVFINTNGLKSVHPFGQVVLHRNLSGLCGRSTNLVFIGDHGRRLSRPWIESSPPQAAACVQPVTAVLRSTARMKIDS
jgi:hypothetical protein